MTVLGSPGLSAIVPVLLVLACPLIMVFMMRGMHGGHSHGRQGDAQEPQCREEMTLDELKRERDALNAQIAQRAERAADDARRERAVG